LVSRNTLRVEVGVEEAVVAELGSGLIYQVARNSFCKLLDDGADAGHVDLISGIHADDGFPDHGK